MSLLLFALAALAFAAGCRAQDRRTAYACLAVSIVASILAIFDLI